MVRGTLNREKVSALNVEGKDGLIYELEALLGWRGVLDLCSQLWRTDLVLFLDNDAALRALVKSSSSSPFAKCIVSHMTPCDFPCM